MPPTPNRLHEIPAVAVNVEEGFFLSSDSLRLFYHLRQMPQAKATLVAVHGLGEHMGRYQELFRELAHPALNFAGFDLRGSGRSEGLPADASSFQEYLHDLSGFMAFLHHRFSADRNHAWILFGHSLGGLIALQWARIFGDSLAALMLSAPFLGFRFSGGVSCLNQMVFALAPHFVYQNPVYPSHLSHDIDEVTRYRQDPLIRRMISARLIHVILKETASLQRMPEISLKMPLLALLPGDERVVDGKAGRRILESITAPFKEIKTYPGFYHEIFHEIERSRVFHDLASFLGPLIG